MSIFAPQELNGRAQGEVSIREAIRELELWGAGTTFLLTSYSDSHSKEISIIKDWKDLVNQVPYHYFNLFDVRGFCLSVCYQPVCLLFFLYHLQLTGSVSKCLYLQTFCLSINFCGCLCDDVTSSCIFVCPSICMSVFNFDWY